MLTSIKSNNQFTTLIKKGKKDILIKIINNLTNIDKTKINMILDDIYDKNLTDERSYEILHGYIKKFDDDKEYLKKEP